jgi:hypothetical protein
MIIGRSYWFHLSSLVVVGIIPTMQERKLVKASDAIELVGLTRSQLREWTSRGRRELILPDVEPNGSGSHAFFSWQTLLALRLLLALHTDFAAEVGAWAPAARDLRLKLENVYFGHLWGACAFFPSPETSLLIEEARAYGCAGVILPLEPHLAALASKLSLPRPTQLSLFPSAGEFNEG